MLKVFAHAAVILVLYLAFSFALFLGLQVRPLYGNIGLPEAEFTVTDHDNRSTDKL